MFTRTVRIPLALTPEQALLTLTTMKQASEAFNLLAGWAVCLIVGYAGVGRKLVVSYKNRVKGSIRLRGMLWRQVSVRTL